MPSPARSYDVRGPVVAYLWWAVVGALYGFGTVAILTGGILLILAATALTVVGVCVPHRRGPSVPGLLGGLAVAPLLLAWLNRDGPGSVCHAIPGGTECTTEWSPWPFVLVAAGLVAASVVLLRRLRAG